MPRGWKTLAIWFFVPYVGASATGLCAVHIHMLSKNQLTFFLPYASVQALVGNAATWLLPIKSRTIAVIAGVLLGFLGLLLGALVLRIEGHFEGDLGIQFALFTFLIPNLIAGGWAGAIRASE